MERALSAAGKLFLSGEYAVLWGGVARVAAVGPRAWAHVRRRDDREVHLIIESGRLTGHTTPLGVRWQREVPPELRFAARAIGDALRVHGREDLGLSLALASSPTVGGEKLGLGGSARAALLSAEAARFVLEERIDALKLALLSHAAEQGGKGSGADVAAIFAGGVIRYRRYAIEALLPDFSSTRAGSTLLTAPPVDLWRVPTAPVFLTYAFSGGSASTPALIARAEEKWSAARRQSFADRSDALGDSFEDALRRGDFELLRETVAALHAHVMSLGGLETELMARILALARSSGSVGKVSGAGGGDGCVLFSPDEERRREVGEALRARGIFSMPIELEAGLRGEASPDPQLIRWLA